MKTELPKNLGPFLWYFIKPYKGMMLGLVSATMLWGIQSSLSPYLLKMIIDLISNYHGDKAHIFSVIKFPLLAYIFVWTIMAFNFRILDWIKLKLYPTIRQNIIDEMFVYLCQHSYRFMQNNFAGTLSNKILDLQGACVSVYNQFEEFIANFFALSIGLIAMYLVNPLFSFLFLIWAFSFFTITYIFSKKTTVLSHIFSESRSMTGGKVVDAITNLNNIRLFARFGFERNRLNKAVEEVVGNDRAMQRYMLKMRICWDFTFIGIISAMFAGLVYLYSHGKITVGDFVFIMTLSLNIFMFLWNVASHVVQFSEDLGKCTQALTIIKTPHEIMDIPQAKPLNVTKGHIVFENVSFHYEKSNRLFENKYVSIEPGTKVGLVGFSGSGKTSFVHLILRLFDVESGRILIDDQNIARVTQDSLHEQITMIPQDTNLFHRSLKENIRYGRPDATDDEVIEASKKAYCNEFIDALPEGYEALVGERGIKLSGGQRQRIAIARAMLKKAPIFILDEATSALDSVTEKHIQKALHILMQNRTTIVIAHRLSTLSEMDRILVFDKGHIIEDGSHQSLLQNNGHYARMWHMQAGGFLPEKDERGL